MVAMVVLLMGVCGVVGCVGFMERPQGNDTWVSGESGPTPPLHSTPRTPADEMSAGFATLNCGYAVQSEAWQRACLHTNRLRCCSACRPVDAGTCSVLRTPLHTELAAYLSHLATHTSASTQRHAGQCMLCCASIISIRHNCLHGVPCHPQHDHYHWATHVP